MAPPYLEGVLTFALAAHCVHAWLDLRQRRELLKRSPPPALAGEFGAEKFAQIRRYALDKWSLGFCRSTYHLGEQLIILGSGALPWLWDASARAVPAAAARGEVAHTVIFALVAAVASALLDLPWSAYSTFVVEARNGFNKTTPATFVSDLLKSLLLTALLAPPLVAGVTWILLHSGPWLPLQLWGFILGVSLLLLAAYPTLIAPLFNRFEPLPAGSLKTAVEQLAARLNFPLKQLYVVDGSRRSAHSNAYMYGFGCNKRIVLFDTLLDTCAEDEVVAVLAHELGHWKLRHVPVTFALGQALALAQFSLFAAVRTAPGLYESFGFTGAKPAVIALVLFGYLSAPLDEILHVMTNAVSRRFEYDADAFAVSLGMGRQLRGGLLHLEATNKAALNVDPLYSAYHYSHPPLCQRLAAIDEAMRGQEKKGS